MPFFRKQLRAIRGSVSLGLTLAVLNAGCDLFWPTIIATIVDDGILVGNADHIRKMLIVMVCVGLFAAVVKYSKNCCAVISGNRYARNTRRDLFEKVLSLPSGDVSRMGTASLLTRCTNDISAIGLTLDQFIRMMVRIPLTCIGGMILAFALDWRMALIILAVIPLIAWLSLRMLRSTMPKYGQLQNALDRFNRVLRERLWAVRVIRVFCKDAFEQDRLEDASGEMCDVSTDVERRIGLISPLMTMLVNLTILLLVLYAAHMGLKGMVHIGALISCIQYANQILMAILQSAMLLSRLPRTAVSIRRIEDVMAHVPSVADEGVELPDAQADTLTFDHVSYRFPASHEDALHDVCFSIRKGETIAVIGSTGCGKSTLVNLAERFIDPTGGCIRLGETDITHITQKELRKRLSVVPQQAFLFEGTIRDNLLYGDPHATEEEMLRALDIAQATEFVLSFEEGLDHIVSSGGTNLSGGQRQRLSIARALLRKPDFYLFDDSFSALDLKTDAAVRQGLKSAMGDAGYLIVAQRVSTIRHADRILVLDTGRVVGFDRHDALLRTCPVYRQIVQSQYEGGDADVD